MWPDHEGVVQVPKPMQGFVGGRSECLFSEDLHKDADYHREKRKIMSTLSVSSDLQLLYF
jgi:hypothetical protein